MSALQNAVAAIVHDINAEGQDRGLEGEEADLMRVGVGEEECLVLREVVAAAQSMAMMMCLQLEKAEVQMEVHEFHRDGGRLHRSAGKYR